MKNNFNLFKIVLSLMLLFAIPLMVFADNSIIEAKLVNQDPAPVVAGNVVEIRLSIENVGTLATGNIYVEVDDSFPFTVEGDKVQNVGSLLAGQYDENKQIVKFKLKVDKDAGPGTHSITVKTYEEGKANLAKEFNLPIDIKSEDSIEISKIDTTVLIPGKEQTVTFTITNVGSSNLKDLTFSWENPDKIILPVGSDNSVYISDLEAGKSIDIKFNVIASTNAVADLYNLDLKISYQNSITGTSDSSVTSAGMYVGGGTDFDVVYNENSEGEYAFTVANIGSNDATSVVVKVPSQDAWTTTNRNSEIIGNLNKGDYTTTTFNLQSKRTASSSPIKFDIIYTDTMGLRNTIEKDVIISEAGTGVSNFNSTRTYGSNNGAIGGRTNPMRNLGTGISTATTYAKYLLYAIIIAVIVGVVFMVNKKKKSRK